MPCEFISREVLYAVEPWVEPQTATEPLPCFACHREIAAGKPYLIATSQEPRRDFPTHVAVCKPCQDEYTTES